MTTRTVSTLLAGTILTAACGGGGGGGGATAGIDRGGAPVAAAISASGRATAFGSIVVNGERYATGAATVTVDGRPSSETAIMPGHVVEITGEIDAQGNRAASTVALLHDVEGPIEGLNRAGRTFVVLGQTVSTDDATSFDAAITPRSLQGLSDGLSVEISGFRTANGAIRASRIELDDDNDPYRVVGALTGVDVAARTAVLNDLTIEYATAVTLEGFPSGQPRVGDFVLAEGDVLNGPRHLVATRLTRVSAGPLDLSTPGTTVEIEGLVTRFASLADFDVDGQRVAASGQTAFVGGAAAAVQPDRRLAVRGTAASGVLNAAVVAFTPAITTRLQSSVEAIDTAARTVTVLGTRVRALADTTVEDLRDDERVFDIGDLRLGDQLEVYGYEEPPGGEGVAAVRLEREDDSGGAELTGFVRGISDPEFRILGVRVLTTPDTEFDDIGRDEFFAAGLGRRFEVEGVYSNGTLTAAEIEPAD